MILLYPLNLWNGSENKPLTFCSASLSPDSVPALAAAYQDQTLPGVTHAAVGAALICYEHISSGGGDQNRRSFTLSGGRADQALRQVQSRLGAYQIVDSDWPVKVLTPGSIYYECYQNSMGN
jgi:hypothetical protein